MIYSARMALKTQPNKQSVKDFLATVEDEQRRKDCKAVARIMAKATGKRATMWGDSIVGYGRYEYKYKSGHEGAWFLTGFSPRKRDLTVYIMPGFDKQQALLKKLGPHKKGKSCLYLKSLDGIDTDALTRLVEDSIVTMRKRYNVNS